MYTLKIPVNSADLSKLGINGGAEVEQSDELGVLHSGCFHRFSLTKMRALTGSLPDVKIN